MLPIISTTFIVQSKCFIKFRKFRFSDILDDLSPVSVNLRVTSTLFNLMSVQSAIVTSCEWNSGDGTGWSEYNNAKHRNKHHLTAVFQKESLFQKNYSCEMSSLRIKSNNVSKLVKLRDSWTRHIYLFWFILMVIWRLIKITIQAYKPTDAPALSLIYSLLYSHWWH